MRIALYRDREDERATPLDLSWEELAEYLADCVETPCAPCAEPKLCPHKNRDAWSPVEIAACVACRGSRSVRGEECPACKGTGLKTRANENVKAMTCAVIDLDHIPDARLLEICARLEGHACIIHSTHSHRPPGDGCYRIVFELSRPVLESESGVRSFNDFWRGVLATLIDAFGLPADPSCKDLSRLYYLPTVPLGLPSVYACGEGVAVDVDALLAVRDRAGLVAEKPLAIEPDAAEVAALPVTDAIDLASLRERLRRVRYRKARRNSDTDRERYAVLDRILNGEPLAEPGLRAAALNQAASIVAYCFPSGTPWEAAREVLRPSIAAMDLESGGGQGVDQAMEVAAESYARAVGRKASDDAERERKNAEVRERLRGVMSSPVPGSASRSGAAVQLALPMTPDASSTLSAEPDGLDWRDLLILKPTADNPRALKPCGENVFTILGFAPETADTIRFNLVEKTIEVVGGPFAGTPQEVLKTEITDWLTRYHDLSLPISEVAPRILRVARANDFDPLADYLNATKWDGVDRLSDFLIKYVGARCVNKAGVDITEYVRTIGRRFLISMVARALRPGCKVDTVLVLEGKQGKRKSMFFDVLGGAWYVSDELVLGDKDSKMLAGRCWLVELAECASMKRTETNSQKAFLSRKEDYFRPPYGDNLIKCPRRCVFVGSTNDDFWLSDRTGNRRFWPVYCDAIDIMALRRDRDQVWAQAVAEYRAFVRYQGEGVEDDANPFRWWLNEDEQTFADLQTRERMQDSAIQQKIAAWWLNMRPASRPVEFSMLEIAETVLMLPIDRITKSVETEIGIAIRVMGFGKRRRMKAGVDGYVYFPTDELRDAPQGVRGSHLASVPIAAAV